MKAINIGYSTEDSGMWLELIPNLQRYEWLYFIKDQLQWGELLTVDEAVAKLQEEFDKYKDLEPFPGLDEYVAEWTEKMEKFKAATKDQKGLVVEWGIEYDAQLMFVFDSTKEDVQALNDVDMDDESQYDKPEEL